MAVCAQSCGLQVRWTASQKLAPGVRVPGLAHPSGIEIQRQCAGVTPAVHCGARPTEEFALQHHAGTRGIEFGVAQSGPQVLSVQWAGIIASLPDVA